MDEAARVHRGYRLRGGVADRAKAMKDMVVRNASARKAATLNCQDSAAKHISDSIHGIIFRLLSNL